MSAEQIYKKLSDAVVIMTSEVFKISEVFL
jgi:hypothetical protein